MSTDAFQAPSPDYLAELLPQYGIESFIAQGGMGAVYKARQISLDRDVAIKVLPKELGGDAEFRESFLTEAKAMAKLNHPNLLGVFDYGDVDGMPYIVMEYVEGGSLHQAAWNQAIEPASAVAIVKGICDGLAHAHENGIIHRDIKPSNILLTIKAEPKVADFGLAHSTDAEESGMMMGTPGYTAPEVFHDPGQAGVLADVYSVGVILHQLLTGIDPAGSAGPPTKPTGNLRLDAIWRKATNIHPAQRYPSMAAMASELDKWLGTTKKVADVATGRPAYTPPKRTTQTIGAGGGGMGVFPKIIIIGILAVAVYFTYGLLKERNQMLKDNIADAKKGTDAVHKTVILPPPPAPVTDVLPPEPEVPDNEVTGNVGDEGNDNETAVNPADPDDGADADEYTPGDPLLLEQARGLILKARGKRDEAFAANAREMSFQIGAAARTVKRDDMQSILDLRDEITENRIPLTDEAEGLPDALMRDFERARAKEGSIIESYKTELTRIRDSYVSRLLAKAEENKEADGATKRNLVKQANLANDLDGWIDELAPEPEWEPGSISGPGGGGGDFAGKWVEISDGGESHWISHSDGTMECVGRDWEGSWEMLPDGTVEVRWEDKPKPYVYEKDGDGWTGKTSFGRDTSLSPGRW